jgi:hypothetical protein
MLNWAITVPLLAEMLMEHMGNVGTSLRWELQLLAIPVES